MDPGASSGCLGISAPSEVGSQPGKLSPRLSSHQVVLCLLEARGDLSPRRGGKKTQRKRQTGRASATCRIHSRKSASLAAGYGAPPGKQSHGEPPRSAGRCRGRGWRSLEAWGRRILDYLPASHRGARPRGRRDLTHIGSQTSSRGSPARGGIKGG